MDRAVAEVLVPQPADRPHVGPNIRLWMGDSRGRWEGNTLVVDTTNFTDKGWIASHGAAGRMKGIPQSEALHVVERFMLVDADTISYEATIEDPNVYTRPWKVAFPLNRDQKYQMFEYACHEGNKAVENILRGVAPKRREPKKPRRRHQGESDQCQTCPSPKMRPGTTA